MSNKQKFSKEQKEKADRVQRDLLRKYHRDMKRKLYFGHLPEEQQRKLMP